MRKLNFIPVFLLSISLVPIVGNAQRKPLSRSEQEKRNATFLREVSYARPARIKELLAAGAELEGADDEGHAVSKYGETPLKMALATNNAATVALLKQHGARVGLAEAAFSGDSEQVQALLRDGADIHSAAVTSALETAIRIENPGMVKLLLAAGADPNARDREGMSLLMQAVGEGRLPIVQAMLDG